MMDELVFARESLRRSLIECVSLLEKAAESYDPESDFPMDDILAAITVTGGLRNHVKEYSDQVTHRIKSRTGAAGDGGER